MTSCSAACKNLQSYELMIFPRIFLHQIPDIFLRYRVGRGAWFGFPQLLFRTLSVFFARHSQANHQPDGARITCPHGPFSLRPATSQRVAELLACHHLCRLSSTSCACSSGSAAAVRRSAWQYLLPAQVHAGCREAQVYPVRTYFYSHCV